MSIDKEFTPYQESFELKELGFDEPCLGGYIKFRGSGTFELAFYKDRNVDFNKTSNIYVSAPTFSQAFRWFREKYNMKPCFDWHPTEKYRYVIYYSKNMYFEKIDFETHEEAELACLRKLIEIVKEKS